MPQQFDLGNFADNCTIAGATGSSTADGHPIIAGNSDDPFTTRTRLVVVHPDDGYRFVATQIVSPTTAIRSPSTGCTRGASIRRVSPTPGLP